jgi:L-ascorbate metabolism protein UlaG (beta-lactamase superfamily)
MKKLKKIMIIIAVIILALAGSVYWFMQQSAFGTNPEGERLKRIESSPNYKDGSFQNLNPTEVMLKETSYMKVMKEFFNKKETVAPSSRVPSVQTDLKSMVATEPTLVWFGHSSYMIRSKDLTLLVDPVFSGNASPISFFGKAFDGADVYPVSSFPNIDIMVITHDHYDHLDYKTITEFKPKTGMYVVPLGVGAHLEYWGISKDKIIELDWWEEKQVKDSVTFIAAPARHFSGRKFQRGKTLWTSFVLKLHGHSIYIGGDSGYDTHFKTIGEKYGPFKIVLLEAGQYGKDWPYIHMQPEETVIAAQDLKAEVLMPVHWGKFVLANHDWDEPIQRVMKTAKEKGQKIVTPLIGEPVIITNIQATKEWWNF